MMRKAFDFFSSNRVYFLALILISLVYAVFVYGSVPRHDKPASPRYEAFRDAEKQLQSELSTTKQFEGLFKSKPVAAAIFTGYTAVFCLLFFGGCLLILLLLASKQFRSRALHAYPLEAKPWTAAFLLRVLVHFLGLSLFLNLVMSAAFWIWPEVPIYTLTLIHTAVMDAVMAILIWREMGFSRTAARSFGFDLQGRSLWQEIRFGLGSYAAVMPLFAAVLALLVAIAQKFSYEPEPHPLVDVFLIEEKKEQWVIGFSIFLACVWGPFFEEVFFRGLCYPLFKRWWGVLPGAVVSAAFFAVIHKNEFAFLPIFVLGLGLAWLYEKRGNLAAPVALHIFHNTLFIGYFFSAKSIMGT